MGLFDGLANPLAPGQAFAAGFRQSQAEREEREVRGALSAYAMNPDDPKAFEKLAQYRPEIAIQIRGDRDKRAEAAQVQQLTMAASQGDPAALAQLAGIDFDRWKALDARAQADTAKRVDYIGNAALDIKRLPPEQRPAAWDRYIAQGVQQGYEELAEFQGQYSEEGLDAAIAQAGKMQDFLKTLQPDYQAVPYESTLVNVRDPVAVAAFAGGAGRPQGDLPTVNSPDEAAKLPPGTRFLDPNGVERMVPGGPTQMASGTFRGGFRGLEGETVTSTFRTPERNRQVGGVANSFHLRRYPDGSPMARDSQPPPGMSMAEYARRLQALNPDLEVINEGDHVHMEPRG